jgi:hypothetical protein
MAETSSSSEVPPKPSTNFCVPCIEYREKIEKITKQNHVLHEEIKSLRLKNENFKSTEKEFKEKVDALLYERQDLRAAIFQKQSVINLQANKLEKAQQELAMVKSSFEALDTKVSSYSETAYLLDHILDSQRYKPTTKGVGYHNVPAPVHHDLTVIPEPSDSPKSSDSEKIIYEPKQDQTKAVVYPEQETRGLGSENLKSDISQESKPTPKPNGKDNVIIEDWVSDGETDDVSKESFEIPLENHIACEPSHLTLAYMLKGSDVVYSDKEMPIENINPNKILRKFYVRNGTFSIKSDESNSSSSNSPSSSSDKRTQSPFVFSQQRTNVTTPVKS